MILSLTLCVLCGAVTQKAGPRTKVPEVEAGLFNAENPVTLLPTRWRASATDFAGFRRLSRGEGGSCTRQNMDAQEVASRAEIEDGSRKAMKGGCSDDVGVGSEW